MVWCFFVLNYFYILYYVTLVGFKGGRMRELILVSVSALLGYIIFSAFSTTDTPKEAFRKIIEQPTENRQVTQDKVSNKHEEHLISLQNQHKLEQLELYGKIEMHNKENQTKIELKKLDNDLDHKIAILNIESKGEDKNKDNGTFIILALLIFLLIFIYLKHKKYLNEIELDKQDRYNEMMAKKEYAEKILGYISEGNLSFETERKLLTILDELNGKTVQTLGKDELYHPNPDIIQLSHHKKEK